MHRNIKNQLCITVRNIDLTTVSNVEFYIAQGEVFLEYTPEVIDAHTMLVTVPFADAMRLSTDAVYLQFALTDSNGNPRASNKKQIAVGDLLKKAGYDPV